VKTFLVDWLKTKKASIKPKTYDLYESTIRLYLEAELGPIKLIDLRADHLQKLYAGMLERGVKSPKAGEKPKGLSPRTVQIAHRLIHAALADAVRWNLVPRNVAEAATAPRPRRPEMKVWTPIGAARFLNATADERLGPAYAILLSCGLRLGELLALRWEDIDLDRRRIQIRRTIQRLKRGQGLVVGEPKSAQGRRQLVLSNLAVEALRRWRVRQKEERLQSGPAWTESGYVFSTSVGTATEPRNFHRSFDNAVKRLGMPPIRVHDTRHACATILLTKGVHPKVVQELLGHGQISLTLDTYSHVLPTMQEDAARTLEAVYGAS
jgi:integrase